MLVLVTYDVATSDKSGQKRLRQVAKICVNHGQRVQKSVFECWLPHQDLVRLRQQLLDVIEPAQDSLRFYFLGSNWEYKVEHYGKNPSLDMDGPLII
ncbi:MAG: CRISPR-associated endonuclease Cas2 [Planctomycetaceae bacterium]|nr:CRISPR-associated endonuclease Cas2 [Planctomycetaceae bacterium]